MIAAGITFIFAVCLMLDAVVMNSLNERAATHVSLYWVVACLWLVMGGFDILSISNGQRSCEKGFQEIFPGSDCNNDIYGVTLAIDAAMLILWGWLLMHLTAAATLEYPLFQTFYSPAIARTKTVSHDRMYKKGSFFEGENPQERELTPEQQQSFYTQRSANTQRSVHTLNSVDEADKLHTGMSRL
jgi:hypothetical protein